MYVNVYLKYIFACMVVFSSRDTWMFIWLF